LRSRRLDCPECGYTISETAVTRFQTHWPQWGISRPTHSIDRIHSGNDLSCAELPSPMHVQRGPKQARCVSSHARLVRSPSRRQTHQFRTECAHNSRRSQQEESSGSLHPLARCLVCCMTGNYMPASGSMGQGAAKSSLRSQCDLDVHQSRSCMVQEVRRMLSRGVGQSWMEFLGQPRSRVMKN
jgi:hypothetical protein